MSCISPTNSSFLTRNHIFDLDGTLVDTNYANFLAYRAAIFATTNIDIINLKEEYNPQQRFTRQSLKRLFPTLTAEILSEIIKIKETKYVDYLSKTCLLQPFNEILKNLDKDKCFLLTTATKKRVFQILDFYRIRSYFNQIFCKEDIDEENKFAYFIKKLNISPTSAIVYENEEIEMQNAISLGMELDSNTRLSSFRQFTISKNHYLKKDVTGFFSLEYVRFKKPGNPDFINVLKNTYGNENTSKLKVAADTLEKVLLGDLPRIAKILGKEQNELVLCSIPRAKKDDSYNENQLLFRTIISAVARKLNMIDGTKYLIRTKNTRTTHLSHCVPNYNNDGADPFPGITKSTCIISTGIQGKDILLIDDIYTLNVNIDEDGLQTLIDAGAKSVHFYAVGRTVK